MFKPWFVQMAGPVILLLGGVSFSRGQEGDTTTPPADSGPVLQSPDPVVPPDTGSQDPSGTLDWQWTRTNPSGNNVHERRQETTAEGTTLYREHTVTNPHGQKTQIWQQTTTDSGVHLQQQQTWTAPDGTLQRQHQWSTSQTDPYNTSRQHTIIQSPDRTMTRTQTRTWDGTPGTMERTFEGPNGQHRVQHRPWTPDDLPTDPSRPTVVPADEPTGPVSPLAQDPAPGSSPERAAQDAERPSLLERFKSWVSKGPKSGESTASQARRGFTLGTGGRTTAQTQQQRLATQDRGLGQAMRQHNEPSRGLGASGQSHPSSRGKTK